ncbi:hypothetical protein SALWKB29_1113 [Snodgrassella communis]|uniref:Uncharacterized protein n=1 Tax=Snodgrassella communis TaxID=2946699 RepID=A0A837AGV3_9NEIS|nr:hypothetical protein SALWKB29_1113 [Snodgrassella communis]
MPIRNWKMQSVDLTQQLVTELTVTCCSSKIHKIQYKAD